MENGSLMKVESIAECSPLVFFFVFFLSGRLRQVLLYLRNEFDFRATLTL